MLERDFFARDALVVARALVGTRIVHGDRRLRASSRRRRTAGRAISRATRARGSRSERARSSARRATRTCSSIYGMYDCFNVVCKGEGAGHAVLVRGGEIDGHRADGPGKLRARDGAHANARRRVAHERAPSPSAARRAREHRRVRARRRAIRRGMGRRELPILRRAVEARLEAVVAANRERTRQR